MMKVHITNETNRLKAVILGTAINNGATPTLEQAYDPKSAEHIKAGTYPKEADMIEEMEAFASVLKKYEVQVFRPEIIPNCNQIFARDIGFVLEDKFFKANILPDREEEYQAIEYIVSQIPKDKVIIPPAEVHIEGGDVMPWNEHIFIGTYKGDDYKEQITARTNINGVEFIKSIFPNKIIKEFDLVKSKTEPRDNALHLDCCFQPVGKDKGIIYKGGFRNEKDYQYLVDIFGKENLFHIEREEMYEMFSNVFSIAPNVVVTERNFKRLNQWLRENGFVVEEIPYREISKQEGLLRCSTLPLLREE
ncbi:MAG: arginine deiminase family protein [Capnocytophaga sp.]|nr:arginine deiminase family protein [Capnocytophaga sp.]